MYFKKSLIYKFLCGSLALASCSVLENRSQCPCFMTLDLSYPGNGVCDSLMVNVCSDDGFNYTEYVGRQDYGRELCLEVPTRKGVYVNVLEKAVGVAYFGKRTKGLDIPCGQQCPRAFMYTSFCKTPDEQCTDTVRIRKNYCGVSMTFVADNLQDYEVQILGDISGYSLSGEPVAGDFRFRVFDSDPRMCFFCVPRQIDQSLCLSISTSGQKEARIFALGNYIAQSGYDWMKEDLDDIVLRIDYASTGITVTINDWKIQENFDIRI